MTEFSPVWNLPFWSATYPDQSDINIAHDWILENESNLINKYFPKNKGTDGGTGLGVKSLTAQYHSFNLFQETKDIDAFNRIFKFIRNEYEKFMIEYNSNIRKCSLYCWANVVRTGQTINKHHHGAWHYSYLSGNMHFGNYETMTSYYNPYGDLYYDQPNIKGGLTFFPSYLLHSVNEHKESCDRVSIAFDIFDKQHLDKHDNNHVDF